MKNLFKFFLIAVVCQVKIFAQVPIDKAQKGAKESKPDFFIIRFQSSDDKKADKKFEQLINNRTKPLIRNKLVFDNLPTPPYLDLAYKVNGSPYRLLKDNDMLGEKYFKDEFKMNNNFIIPTQINGKQINEIVIYYHSDEHKEYKKSLTDLAGKAFILRSSCSKEQLKKPNFSQFKLKDLNLCVEIQDVGEYIVEQNHKLKAELTQALPDMLPELRNIVQEYMGTDFT